MGWSIIYTFRTLHSLYDRVWKKSWKVCFILAELLIGNINFDLKINGVGNEENVVEKNFLENRKKNKFQVNLFDVFFFFVVEKSFFFLLIGKRFCL